ncbi:MAG TPA: SCO family protein [Alphaproteobacteria bacterium]|nr:SCO family protein [Alphaproteobacteria bacterium]
MTPTLRRLATIVGAVLIGVAIGFGARFALIDDRQQAEAPGIGTALIGGPFALTDQNGARRLDAEFRGKLMLVFFGYTYCPDICPLSLQLVSDVLDALGSDAGKVAPIFITVDPRRDTASALKNYLANFSPQIVGLTGTEEEIAAVAKAYRAYFKLNGDPAKDEGYLVDHTTLIYVMDRQGKLLTQFTHETPPERVTAALRPYL